MGLNIGRSLLVLSRHSAIVFYVVYLLTSRTVDVYTVDVYFLASYTVDVYLTKAYKVDV